MDCPKAFSEVAMRMIMGLEPRKWQEEP
jgi:hypothetical protein